MHGAILGRYIKMIYLLVVASSSSSKSMRRSHTPWLSAAPLGGRKALVLGVGEIGEPGAGASSE
jgi:hypothetical protein